MGFAALVICTLLALPAAAQAAEGERSYALYVPKAVQADPATPAPLVLLLHGSGGSGEEMVRAWRPLADAERVILLAPDAEQRGRWTLATDGPAILCELVEAIKEQHAVDDSRVYLFGHSAGALFALTVGLMESEYFAGVATYGGAWREASEFQVLQLARRAVPVKLLVGSVDPLFPVPLVRATADALQDHGIAAEIAVFPGQNHAYAPAAETINRAAWQYLAPRRLESRPVYVDYPIAKPAAAP